MALSSTSVIAITGAASGIGRALALRLAREGVAGIAVADVNETGLGETFTELEKSGVKATKHIVDTAKLEQVEAFRDAAIAAHGRVTHLVNNAGVALVGSFEEISLDDFEWLMNINFWGVVYGCKAFLPHLKTHDSAHIVNISSVFGMIAPPDQTAYCAAKFAVRGFTESLRHELDGTGVRVSSVHPGGIKTNIARSARVGEGASENYKKTGSEFFDKVARSTPEFAAETILRGIKTDEPRILIGSDAAAINVISRLFPRRYLRILERLSGHKFNIDRSQL